MVTLTRAIKLYCVLINGGRLSYNETQELEEYEEQEEKRFNKYLNDYRRTTQTMGQKKQWQIRKHRTRSASKLLEVVALCTSDGIVLCHPKWRI